MTTVENTAQNMGPDPNDDENIEAGEPLASDTAQDAESITDSSDVGAETDETPEANEDSSDPDIDTYVEDLAAQLTAADPAKYEALVQKFQGDEAFDAAEIAWIASVTQLNEPTIRYGLSLQREEYARHVADEAAKVDASVADAEAEVGNLDELINTVRAHVAPERWAELVEEQKLATRLGERAKANRDTKGMEAANSLTLNILRELKQIRDTIPGKKPKTLGHLSASQGSTPTTPTKQETPPTDSAQQAATSLAASIDSELSQMSSQRIAGLVQNHSTDPAVKARAVAMLRSRGVI